MQPRGKHILVKPEPRELKLPSGIYIPDTATPQEQEFGEVIDGNGIYPDGSRVLYSSSRCYERDGLKLVDKSKVIYAE